MSDLHLLSLTASFGNADAADREHEMILTRLSVEPTGLAVYVVISYCSAAVSSLFTHSLQASKVARSVRHSLPLVLQSQTIVPVVRLMLQRK